MNSDIMRGQMSYSSGGGVVGIAEKSFANLTLQLGHIVDIQDQEPFVCNDPASIFTPFYPWRS